MANYRKGEPPFTHWTHIENGAAIPRRFHKIIEHYGDGPGIELKGNRMPYAVVTCSGDGHKGQHVAHFYYKSDTPMIVPNFHSHRSSARRYYEYERPWPNRRDVINLALGLIALAIFRFVALV